MYETLSYVVSIYDDRKQRHRPHHPYAERGKPETLFSGRRFLPPRKISRPSPHIIVAPPIFSWGGLFFTQNKKIRYPKDTRIQKIRGSERYLPWLPRYFSGGTKDKIYTNNTQKILRGSKIKYIRYGPGVH